METYLVKRKNPEITVNEIDWRNVPSAAIEHRQWANNEEIRAKAQVLYDENALYVHLSAVEPVIRAEENGPLGAPCEDSCLEFFFSPAENDIRYFNIEVNPNGCMYLGLATTIENLVRLLPECDTPIQPECKRTADGWTVTYSVPLTFIRRFFPEVTLYSGKKIRANFFKCGDKTVKEHYFSWNEIGGTKVSFHQPQYFGELRLE